MKETIFLIGFSGTGKTAAAERVARRLGWESLDTDAEIEKLAGKSIPEIFSQDGEPRFRELESEVLRQVCSKERAVIATGGGIVISEENRRLMSREGLVVLLEAEPETIHARLLREMKGPGAAIRPLLAVSDPLSRIKELKSFRRPFYRAAAHVTLATDNLNLEELAERIVRLWNRWREPPQLVVHTPSRNYPVFVGWGVREALGLKMRQLGLRGKAILVSDDTVFSLYGNEMVRSLEAAGFEPLEFTVPPGEASKTLDMAASIYRFLAWHRVEREDAIVALGGGMIGDLAGFVAATYLRGLPLIQVPTTLVAMVDSSIGGKVAVNLPQAKNLVGAFYQPRLVLVDAAFLDTLPPRELISGWAEVIKHGFIWDRKLVDFLEERHPDLRRLDPEPLVQAIRRSLEVKSEIVSRDEREAGLRMLLNFGHSVGHGLEAATEYEHFLHGEAVAVGMRAAALIGQEVGVTPDEVVDRLETLLEKFGLPLKAPGASLEKVLAAMELDKKTREGSLRWVLLEDVGRAVIKSDIPPETVRSILTIVL